MEKLKLAVFKFASCDGCQLTLLDLEDELLTLAETVEIAYFLEARRRTLPGPYDVTLVEGSVSTPHQAEQIQEIRRQSRLLVTIGACATAGGIQALRNDRDFEGFRTLYPNPEWVETLATSTPIADHVPVDLALHGCPISREQLLTALTALIQGRRPALPGHSVCLECKRRRVPCVLVSQGMACLGPVTRTGCGALCPAYGRACYGCFGPCDDPNPHVLAERFLQLGLSREAVARTFRKFYGYSEPFREVAARFEGKE